MLDVVVKPKDPSLKRVGQPVSEERFDWFPRFLKGLEEGLGRIKAAEAAGVWPSTLYNVIRNHPEMAQEILDAEEVSLEAAGQVLYKIMLDDDHPDQYKAARYISETRLSQWRRQADRVEVTRVNVDLAVGVDNLDDRISAVLSKIAQRALSAAEPEALDTTAKEVKP